MRKLDCKLQADCKYMDGSNGSFIFKCSWLDKMISNNIVSTYLYDEIHKLQ